MTILLLISSISQINKGWSSWINVYIESHGYGQVKSSKHHYCCFSLTHTKWEYISCFKKSSSLYPRLWIFRISSFSSWILSQPCGNVSLSLVMVQIHVNFFGLALPWTGSDINSFAPKRLDLKVGVLTPNGFLIRRALGFFFFFIPICIDAFPDFDVVLILIFIIFSEGFVPSQHILMLFFLFLCFLL